MSSSEQYRDFSRDVFSEYWEFESDGIIFSRNLDRKKYKFTNILSVVSIVIGTLFCLLLILAIVSDKFISPGLYQTIERDSCIIIASTITNINNSIYQYQAECSMLFNPVQVITTKYYGENTTHELAHIYCILDCPIDPIPVQCGIINETSPWTTINISKCSTYMSQMAHQAGYILFFMASGILGLYLLYLIVFSIFVIVVKIYIRRRYPMIQHTQPSVSDEQ